MMRSAVYQKAHLPGLEPGTKRFEVQFQLMDGLGTCFVNFCQIFEGSGFLLQCILAIAHQKVSLWRSTLIVLASFSIGMVAGGLVGTSAAIYRWTSGGKGSMQGATLASIFLPQFNTIMLVLVSIFGLVHLILVHSLTKAQLIGFGATLLILGIIIGGAALMVRFRNQATQAVLWMSIRVTRLSRKPFDPNATRQEICNLSYTFSTARFLLRHRFQAG